MSPTASRPGLCNCLAIRKAARHVSQFYDQCLAPTGLRVTQFSILARLHRLGPRTITELAADLVSDRTTMGRNIGPLEREGLVAVGADPRDRRRRAVSITGPGTERLQAAQERWTEAQARFERAYGGPEALELRHLLAGVVAVDLDAPAAHPPRQRRPSAVR